AVFPQRLQIFAHAWFHFLLVKFIADFGLDLVQGLLAGVIARNDLQDFKSCLGLHDVGHLFAVEREYLFRDFGVELRALEGPELARLLGRGAVRIVLGHFAKIIAIVQNAVAQIFSFFLQGRNVSLGLSFRGDKNFSQDDGFRTDKLTLMVVVIL